MTDDSGLNCCFWAYNGCQAQQLVFDSQTAYGVRGSKKVGWYGSYSHDIHQPGEGFALKKWSFKKGKAQPPWSDVSVPVSGKAMLLTDRAVYVAGAPDLTPAGDFWAAYENRKGCVLHVVSRDEASPIAEYPLDAMPVYNGMAANAQHLVVCLKDGTIVGFGRRAE